MILLWFVLGILLAFSIARYNQSNKLFWQLVLAFIFGYATAVMIDRTINGNERSSDDLVQVSPTQMPTAVDGAMALFETTAVMESSKVTALNSVVQVLTPAEYEVVAASSKVFGRTRDQPHDFFNTS